MARYYTLWDADTRNMLTAGMDYAAVLAYVRDVVLKHGAAAADRWGLLWEDEDDEAAGGLLVSGDKLADLAMSAPLPDVNPEKHKTAS